jgi:hypothetical protein
MPLNISVMPPGLHHPVTHLHLPERAPAVQSPDVFCDVHFGWQLHPLHVQSVLAVQLVCDCRLWLVQHWSMMFMQDEP